MFLLSLKNSSPEQKKRINLNWTKKLRTKKRNLNEERFFLAKKQKTKTKNNDSGEKNLSYISLIQANL